MVARYGFMEDPNVMKLLEQAKREGFEYKLAQTTFFLGRETIIASKRPGMAIWRERLFATMSVNARAPRPTSACPPTASSRWAPRSKSRLRSDHEGESEHER